MRTLSLRSLRAVMRRVLPGPATAAGAFEAARTAAYALYFPLLVVALFAGPALLVQSGLPVLDAVEYSLFGVGFAYVVGLGALLR